MDTQSTQGTARPEAIRWLQSRLAWEGALDRLRSLDGAPRLTAIAGARPADVADERVHRVA